MGDDFGVAVASGSLRESVQADARFAHAWSSEGVAVQTSFTGAHLLHVATAACILNDLYREAAALGVVLEGVRVDATGTFDTSTWRSQGIEYRVDVDSRSAAADVARLVAAVDDIAEIPRVLRHGAEVRRTG